MRKLGLYLVAGVLGLCVMPLPTNGMDRNTKTGEQTGKVTSKPTVGPMPWTADTGAIERAPRAALNPAQLDSAIQAMMATYHIPGLSACVTSGDSIVWTGSYGFADAALTKPVTDSTLFRLASISKTVLITAVLCGVIVKPSE